MRVRCYAYTCPKKKRRKGYYNAPVLKEETSKKKRCEVNKNKN